MKKEGGYTIRWGTQFEFLRYIDFGPKTSKTQRNGDMETAIKTECGEEERVRVCEGKRDEKKGSDQDRRREGKREESRGREERRGREEKEGKR